jgi:predicted RNA-binding protein
MCLATVYKESDDSVIFKNVSRIDVDGNKLVLRDIMGDERVVEGSRRTYSYGRPGKQHCKTQL